MEFIHEETFDREQYEAYIRRIHYDDRDAAMYENLLNFLWTYITEEELEDKQGLYEEYGHWNLQLIDKVYFRPKDIAYAEICRAYQSIIHLLDGDYESGLEQLSLIRDESFMYDGFAPKTIMVASGKVYRPCSRLFIIYNYYKYFLAHGMDDEAKALKEKYPFAFQHFGDEKHELHDRELTEQLEVMKDQILYPIFSRVYKLAYGPKDFFLYYDKEKCFSI